MKPPTLRDRVRESLDTGAPSEREARADLDAVLAKANGTTHPLRHRYLTHLIYAIIVIGMIVVFVQGFRGPKAARTVATPTATSPSPIAHGVHVYIHVAGEPEAQALSLDLDSKGDL